jgi:hypothetical protein
MRDFEELKGDLIKYDDDDNCSCSDVSTLSSLVSWKESYPIKFDAFKEPVNSMLSITDNYCFYSYANSQADTERLLQEKVRNYRIKMQGNFL